LRWDDDARGGAAAGTVRRRPKHAVRRVRRRALGFDTGDHPGRWRPPSGGCRFPDRVRLWQLLRQLATPPSHEKASRRTDPAIPRDAIYVTLLARRLL